MYVIGIKRIIIDVVITINALIATCLITIIIIIATVFPYLSLSVSSLRLCLLYQQQL